MRRSRALRLSAILALGAAAGVMLATAASAKVMRSAQALAPTKR